MTLTQIGQSTEKVVIVGNGVAGLTAGDTLRRLGFTGPLTIIGQEPYATYSRPALSKAALAPGEQMEVSFLPEPTHGGTVLLGRSTTGLDPQARILTLDDDTELSYDKLVIATGARARRFTSSDREFTLRTLDDATGLRQRLETGPKVTVIGGGPLGMEAASGAIGLGCEVTVIHPGPPMLEHIGPLLAGVLTEAALEHGLTLRNDRVSEVHETHDGMAVSLVTGERITSDIVITAAGDVLNDGWLHDSGLLVDGRLTIDDRCRVRDDIVAAGDIAWLGEADGPRRIPLWTSAIEQAKTAAAALLAGDQAPRLDLQPYFWTDQWDMALKISGPAPHGDETPIVVRGDLSERSAVLHWPEQGSAAALNIRMPIPRLHALARTQPAEL